MPDTITDIMTSLGYSTYEARAYEALVREHPLTGYELSGRSGIPRSKVYESIERLVRKEMAIPVAGNPVRYVPVPPEEVMRRLSADFERSIGTLSDLFRREQRADRIDYIFNIAGGEAIIGKAADMIAGAGTSLDLSLWREELDHLREPLGDAAARGVRIRLLSFGGGVLSEAQVYPHRPLGPGEADGRWITVVKDRAEVLTGHCAGPGENVAAWTHNRNLVFMSLKYIEHEIIKIGEQERT